MAGPVSGTQGYAEEAPELFKRYESIRPSDAHRPVLHLIPAAPSRVLDIGAGTGRDAAWLASLGHRVLAIEPTHALRSGAAALHDSPSIEWLDDSLPDLDIVRGRHESFDLVMLTAVWMHLDPEQRRRAMPNVASQVANGGTVIIKLRHGMVPTGRRMFEVSPDETIGLAQGCGLQPVLNLHTESIQSENRLAGIGWSTVAFVRASAAQA